MSSVFRISTPADAVAAAVLLVRYVPENEMVVFTPNAPVMAVMVCPMGEDAPIGGVPLLVPNGHPVRELAGPRVVVVFGSDTHADAATMAVLHEFSDDDVAVFQFHEGRARCYLMNGVLAGPEMVGEAVDLTAHPYVVAALLEGQVRLASRAQIRAGFSAEQFGTERAASVVDMMRAARGAFPAVGPISAAETIHREVLAGYLDSDNRGIEISDYHAAMLAAAASDVRVRDVLFAHFTEANAAVLGELWRQVGAVLPTSEAGPAFVLASLSYWIGREAVPAREAMNVARELAPDHSLGQLLERAYNAGINPALWEQIRPAARDAESDRLRTD
ncbi:DUF4192 family protein [Rhodococcoides yunnanense]|uniref:DUF4192 family protein n=1 Tax=Rhodococcoides yunnanense TaxID=278209 RepID=UPI0022B172AA|nr:DUF4192 family protein [Rhodococcus yunnanensis]MCZ4278527.1 DUF4192 family protein [Rhodococcus yunnanensis]